VKLARDNKALQGVKVTCRRPKRGLVSAVSAMITRCHCESTAVVGSLIGILGLGTWLVSLKDK